MKPDAQPPASEGQRDTFKHGWVNHVVAVIILIGLVCVSAVLLLTSTISPNPRTFSTSTSSLHDSFWNFKKFLPCKGDKAVDSSCTGRNYTLVQPRHNNSTIPGYEQWLKFAEQNQCHTGSYSGIERDLEAFRDPKSGKLRILKHHVEGAKKLPATAVFTVKRGSLTITGDNVPGLLLQEKVQRMMKKYVRDLPDMEFVVNINDQPRVIPGQSPDRDERLASSLCYNASESFHKHRHLHGYMNNRRPYPEDQPTSELVALFSQAKIGGCHRDIMYPSVYTFDNRVWPNEHALLKDWSDRSDTMFFRGSNTGGIYQNLSTYGLSHRQRLIKLAEGNSNYDFKFTNIIQCAEEVCKAMEAEYGHVPRVPEMKNFDHKYLILVDGNSFVARLPKFLQSGSLVFRAGMFDEWYEEWLHEGVNYVRVALDYSDLPAKLQWAKDNDEAAREIGKRGREMGMARIRTQDMECYLYRLLLEYAAILEL